ncbi:hypothetical protein CDD81_1253 [Ophiocordyceps australis]|uniref:N-acetyltransferase domain-containing protein n=1 Tax=Ophiocordyceps australis TaxID=1399860 RepID=A0A2C5YFY5_9HYPO|nr:hypothetical protein CDD81_1253 [Ophiocordyceps australis]
MERRVPQLDLSNCGPGFSDPAGVLPSLRCSAAFFTFLRANLVLTPSAVASPNLTPYLEPNSPCQLANDQVARPPARASSLESQAAASGPQPQGSAAAHAYPLGSLLSASTPLASLDDIPALSLETLTSRDDRAQGLHLVADSVIQMQPRTQRVLISHPLCLAALTAACAMAARLGRILGAQSLPALLALPTLVALSYLAAVRLCTRGYLALGDDITASWLHPSHHDIVLGARRGGELIGALVLRLEPRRSADTSASFLSPSIASPSSPNNSPRRKNRSRSSSLKGGRGIIRAWTTRVDLRRQGIGRQLLLAAVKKTRDKCGKDAQVGFAQHHANSVVLLPLVLAKSFRRRENRAAEMLDAVAAEWDTSRRRKR